MARHRFDGGRGNESPYQRLIAAQRAERDEGHRVAAVQAFLETRERDLLLPRLPWAQSPEQIEAAVQRIRSELPDNVRRLCGESRLLIADYPSAEQITAEVDPRQIVFVDRIDPERGRFERLWIFTLNLERMVSPLLLEDELARLIALETGGG